MQHARSISSSAQGFTRGQLGTDQASQLPRQKRAGRKGLGPAWGSVAGPGGDAGAGAGATAPGPLYQVVQSSVPVPTAHQSSRRVPKRWRPKPVGAERLFSYMEASDSEDDEDEQLICHLCAMEFLDVEALQTHMVTHHNLGSNSDPAFGERAYRCSVCGYGSACNASHADVVAHKQTHTLALELRCAEPGCRYATGAQAALEEHVRLVHPPLPPLNQKCPHCGFVVLSAIALFRHQKMHHLGSSACPSCMRVLGRFERHKGTEMWPDDGEVVDDEDEVVGDSADEGGGVLLGEPRVVAVAVTERPAISLRCEPTEREAALRVLRRQTRARRRRVLRYKQARAVARGRLACSGRATTSRRQALRDKYLRIMVSTKRRSCLTCPPGRRLLVPVHTPATLCLHLSWRHSRTSFPCDSCDARFRHRYQVLLHASREHAIAEPIVTLTVPQIITQHQLTQMTALDPHQLQMDPDLQHQQLLQQPQFVTHEVFQTQTSDGTVPATQEETYTIDNTRITVSVPVLYACPPQDQHGSGEQLQEQPSQQDQDSQFQYNNMMVPKQVWYPQLTTTPSYYISTQFPTS